ncbi:LacI family DNA-binding transcriptional regulator [Glycomyces buryatensis]|uniref:LacI family transcriptional regulator n=1 Tax=Glycomyces buryatensis TaxID=2570927 RepID=A0A4V4HQY0_9ACTN|nr:LacI family DNA-binding transcriptional regulator [Glycomyces buryatensis]THV35586.1 LacI family transcriptional regulator [Glycomyces buryatensis]
MPPKQSDSEKRPTIRDVAARAGVSVPTVSRALIGNYPVAPATRSKVLRAVRELDYVVNAHARALAGATTKTIAFIVDDVTGPFYAHIARGVETEAASQGRLCLLCTTHGDPERELAVVELMREQHAEAVIVVGGGYDDEHYTERMTYFARALDRAGSHLVLCGRPSLGEDVPATTVHYENESGAYAMTAHLLSAGHRTIAYLGRGPGLSTTDERVAGFRRAHADYGVPLDDTLILPGEFSKAAGYDRTQELLEWRSDVTAIFAATDMVAAGVLRALRKAGVQVPQDMSVAGFDDIPLAADLTPALTTVRVPHEDLGRESVRLALSREQGAPAGRAVLGTHIVVRESVAPPRQPRD